VRATIGVVAACLAVVVAAGAAATYLLSGATLAADPSALARLRLQLLAGSLASVRATAADGRTIPLDVHGGRLVPRSRLTPGETVSISVVVRRPG